MPGRGGMWWSNLGFNKIPVLLGWPRPFSNNGTLDSHFCYQKRIQHICVLRLGMPIKPRRMPVSALAVSPWECLLHTRLSAFLNVF